MRRRAVLAMLGSAAVAMPWAALAQRTARIAFLSPGSPNVLTGALPQFVAEMQKLGWSVGRSIELKSWVGAGDAARLTANAKEVAAFRPDIILAEGSATAIAARDVTGGTVPIVFINATDPVQAGLLTDLARPGGNITGFTSFDLTLGRKWPELLKELVPGATKIVVPYNPDTLPAGSLTPIEEGARAVGFELVPIAVRDGASIEQAISRISGMGAVLLLPQDPFTTIRPNRDPIILLAARNRVPTLSWDSRFVGRGGLISYGPDVFESFRKGASYVNRVLRGEKAGDLPVQNPTKVILAINLKAAKALGLSLPPALLARADEVIE
jgi:putative ABC transport system substrate-binding protein